jgi:hypothetical protein
VNLHSAMLRSAEGIPLTEITPMISSGIMTRGPSRIHTLRLKDLSRNSVTTSPGLRGAAGGSGGSCARPRYLVALYRSLFASRTRLAVPPGKAQPTSSLIGSAASSTMAFRERTTR